MSAEASPNSMLYWWPKVVKIDVPKPVTVVVTIEDVVEDIFRCVLSDGEDRGTCEVAKEKVRAVASILDEAIRTYIGGYPVFMRSDYTSCKHYSTYVFGKPLYRIDSPEDIRKHIYPLIAECHEPLPVHGPFGAPRPNALAVREWLRIARWTDGLPGLYGNVEVRVFVEGGEVTEVYPYYHRSGLEKHVLRKAQNPEAVLRDYSQRYVSTIVSSMEKIVRYAEKIANAEGIREHSWSIDFALAEKNGERVWYFIDMALAKDSWRPEHRTEEDYKISEALKTVLRGATP